MKAKWEEFARFYDKDKKLVKIEWVCFQCPEICRVKLPPNKRFVHCMEYLKK